MDWARGIVVNEGKLEAEVVSTGGAKSLLDLAELYRHGLPTANKAVRRQLTVDFADFTPCDAEEYAAQFGMLTEAGSARGHQVFEVLNEGQRFLVPALALMRAMFRPASRLLSQMFAPSALERICHLEHSDATVQVVVDANWATRAEEQQNSDWIGPLSWMMLHPSARAMADSVHRHAMAGRLSLDLPSGSVAVVLAGFQGSSAVLVTEARLLDVVPADGPDLPGASRSHQVKFLNRDWAEGRDLSKATSTDIPLHKDGSVRLTDDEWETVGPLLAGQRKSAKAYEHCQRSMFEGVLKKLSTGKSWRDSSYTVGDWRNAATTYRRWTKRGTFAAALDALRTMR